MHFDNLVKISRKEAVREIPEISKPRNTLCKHCLQGKKTSTKFKSKDYSTTKTLEIVHVGLCGPTRKKGLNGEDRLMTVKKMTTVCFLNKKSGEFEHFKIDKEMVEIETYFKIKCLRSYSGGEFTSKEFMVFFGEHGIKK
jgi:hypothetical protein